MSFQVTVVPSGTVIVRASTVSAGRCVYSGNSRETSASSICGAEITRTVFHGLRASPARMRKSKLRNTVCASYLHTPSVIASLRSLGLPLPVRKMISALSGISPEMLATRLNPSPSLTIHSPSSNSICVRVGYSMAIQGAKRRVAAVLNTGKSSDANAQRETSNRQPRSPGTPMRLRGITAPTSTSLAASFARSTVRAAMVVDVSETALALDNCTPDTSRLSKV